MPGHVFVIRGDLTIIECDAWLLACDIHFRVEGDWLGDPQEPIRAPFERYFEPRDEAWVAKPEALEKPENWGEEGARVARLKGWQGEAGPRPYLVNIGAYQERPIDWYMTAVRQFLTTIEGELEPARNHRIRPLVALHAVGTGRGGAKSRTASIVHRLLDTLYDYTAQPSCPVDIVFVAFKAGVFAAAQAYRKKLRRERVWACLPERLRCESRKLAGLAAAGQLVIFAGAGISIPAGLPSWGALLRKLARQAGLEPHVLRDLDPLLQAQLIERTLPGMRRLIADNLSSTHCALGHALLASLPVREFVTQNYDDLLERAAQSYDPLKEIPHKDRGDRSRWLLKMHGCIKRAQDIVLTLEDYLRYSDRRAALIGVVQALLLTKHMLVVGFSLSDFNFQRVVDQVRKVVFPGQSQNGEAFEQFATVLLVTHDEAREKLWERELNVVFCAQPEEDFRAAVRLHDVFLDHLLCSATNSASYLLDPDYIDALDAAELELRDQLLAIGSAQDRLAHSPSWLAISQLLRDLGDLQK